VNTDIDQIIRRIAEAEQIAPQEVLFHIEEAIDAAYHSPDPAVQAEWARMPFKGKPTPQEFLQYLVAQIAVSLSEGE